MPGSQFDTKTVMEGSKSDAEARDILLFVASRGEFNRGVQQFCDRFTVVLPLSNALLSIEKMPTGREQGSPYRLGPC